MAYQAGRFFPQLALEDRRYFTLGCLLLGQTLIASAAVDHRVVVDREFSIDAVALAQQTIAATVGNDSQMADYVVGQESTRTQLLLVQDMVLNYTQRAHLLDDGRRSLQVKAPLIDPVQYDRLTEDAKGKLINITSQARQILLIIEKYMAARVGENQNFTSVQSTFNLTIRNYPSQASK
jgi:hypothetical protein